MRSAASALVALLAVALGAWILREHAPEAPALRATDRRARDVALPRAASPESAAPAEPSAPSLPPSLHGTAVDGAYTLAEDGRFLPSPSVLRRFDWFLAATGEEPLAVIRARIEADIARELEGEAAAEALALLDRYLAYREAARGLHDAGLGEADLETRLQRIRELRRAHFGAGTAALLFGEEERMALDALERVRIARDQTLDDAERTRRLAALDAALPEAVARVRSQATVASRLGREEALLREQGGSASDLRRLREQTVGAEAADRLEALDARRAAWQGRLDAYRAERDALRADPEADEADLEALRAAHFAPHELARVRALDAIGDG